MKEDNSAMLVDDGEEEDGRGDGEDDGSDDSSVHHLTDTDDDEGSSRG